MDTIGRYRILRQLGRGGMGMVYLAHDPTLERDVALKLLHHDHHSGLREEAKALAALSHPNIVTIFEIGQHADQDFITMEYLRGRSLRLLLVERPARAVLLAIVAKVASALAAAHRAGILHRDIKPENIIVGDSGEVTVVDFGIAHRMDRLARDSPRAVSASDVVESLRRTVPPNLVAWGPDTEVSAGTQTAFGTPAYMAPEVLVGEESSEASDVYSLGTVIYECLAGRRPHDATNLVEMIAQVIEGEAAPLADPLGPLVGRMLANARPTRPGLVEIEAALARELAPPRAATAARVAPPPRRRWPFAVAGALAAAGVAAGAWLVLRGPAVTPLPPPPAPVTAAVALELLRVDIPTYGAEPPRTQAITDTLAKLIDAIDGAKLTGVAVDPSGPKLHTHYLVRGSITEVRAELDGTLDLVDADSGAKLATVTATTPSPQLAPLLDTLARDLAHAIAPGSTLGPAPNALRAQTFYRLGLPFLEQAHFTDARPYFEQAVDSDPSFFEGWYALASCLAWMEAPEPWVLSATDRALALAPPGPKHELVRGVSLFLHGDFGAARAALEPIEHATAWSADDQRELLDYLGEANWHDGRHAEAFDYFARVLQMDRQFRPATVHAWEYPIARRDAERGKYYIGLAGENPEWLAFSQGEYTELADHGSPLFQLAAQLVLGRTPAPALEPQGDTVEARTYRIARAAEAGDLPRARAEHAALWTALMAQTPEQRAAQAYALESLGEVLVAAELGPEAKQLVGLLAEQSKQHVVRGYHRTSILAAPLLGDAALVVRDHLTERETQLADASDAELAGDHAKAAQILAALVGDPTFFWDYPERAALVRNLRALRRPKEAAAVCTDTMHPALYRTAFLVLRHVCGA